MAAGKRIRSEPADRKSPHKANFIAAGDVQFFKFIAIDHA